MHPRYTRYSTTYVFYAPSKRKFDLTNYVKAPEDWLVQHGVLLDDNTDHVKQVTLCYGGIDKSNPRVDITIEPHHDDGLA